MSIVEFPETSVSLLQRIGDPADENAWREFVLRYQPALHRLSRLLTGSDHEADDGTQELFIKLIAKVGQYRREEGHFRSWLATVAKRALIDRGRRAMVNARREELLKDGDAVDIVGDADSSESDLVRRVERLRAAIEIVRADSPETEWLVFEARVREVPRDFRAIAGELGISEAAARVRWMRLRKKIAAEYERLSQEVA